MRYRILLPTLLGIFSLVSCAHVSFHKDAALKKKTGLKFYTSKPYLLVSYTGAKDNPIKIETIYLPDLKNPTYAVYHRGWGSHIFNLNVNPNGTLSTYGQTADSKGPETINAIGSLLSSVGSGFSSFATGLGTLQKQSANYDKATKAVRDANAILSTIAMKPEKDIEPYHSLQKAAANVAKSLGKIIGEINTDPEGQVAPLGAAKAALEAVQINDSAPTDRAAALKTDLTAAINLITSAVDVIKKGVAESAPPKPDFKLYEIVIENEVTTLREVRVSAAQLQVLQTMHAK